MTVLATGLTAGGTSDWFTANMAASEGFSVKQTGSGAGSVVIDGSHDGFTAEATVATFIMDTNNETVVLPFKSPYEKLRFTVMESNGPTYECARGV